MNDVNDTVLTSLIRLPIDEDFELDISPSQFRTTQQRLYGSSIPLSTGYQLQPRLYTAKDLAQPPQHADTPKPALDIIFVTASPNLADTVAHLSEVFARDFEYQHLDVPELLIKYAEAGDREVLGELDPKGFLHNVERWAEQGEVWVPHRYFTVPFLRRVVDDLVERGERRFIISGVEDGKCLQDFGEQIAAPSAVFSFNTAAEKGSAGFERTPCLKMLVKGDRDVEDVYADLLGSIAKAARLDEGKVLRSSTEGTAREHGVEGTQVDDEKAETAHDTPMSE